MERKASRAAVSEIGPLFPLKTEGSHHNQALLTLPREANATYNARAALLRDIEKVQQNLKGIQDKQFRA